MRSGGITARPTSSLSQKTSLSGACTLTISSPGHTHLHPILGKKFKKPSRMITNHHESSRMIIFQMPNSPHSRPQGSF
jgi:hypothetical protein